MPTSPPRQRICLDRDWRFALGHAADRTRDFEFARDRSLVKSGEARGAAGVKFDDSSWKQVDLPHDWAIELPFVQNDEREFSEHGCHAIGPEYPQNSVGWYRRTLNVGKPRMGERFWLEFDGVFRDSIVWLNGHRLGRHASGHSPFRYDITDLVHHDADNIIAVRVDATGYEGWWYEGAGIYRHVWLLRTSPVHIAHSGVIVRSGVSKGKAIVTVRTMVVNDSAEGATVTLKSEIVDSAGKSAKKATSSGIL